MNELSPSEDHEPQRLSYMEAKKLDKKFDDNEEDIIRDLDL